MEKLSLIHRKLQPLLEKDFLLLTENPMSTRNIYKSTLNVNNKMPQKKIQDEISFNKQFSPRNTQDKKSNKMSKNILYQSDIIIPKANSESPEKRLALFMLCKGNGN